MRPLLKNPVRVVVQLGGFFYLSHSLSTALQFKENSLE